MKTNSVRLDDYELLKTKEVKSTVQEASKDTSNNCKTYMTTCTKRVINFDIVKRLYLNRLGFSEEKAKSVDALCQIDSKDDDGLYMIEFKNGKVVPRDIELKTRDSLLIFQSITNTQLEYIRNNVRLVLVYNEDCNERGFREKKAIAMANRGKVEHTEFGLANLKNFCFKDVIAYSKREFEELFIPIM